LERHDDVRFYNDVVAQIAFREQPDPDRSGVYFAGLSLQEVPDLAKNLSADILVGD
jgi:hypothetical protein